MFTHTDGSPCTLGSDCSRLTHVLAKPGVTQEVSQLLHSTNLTLISYCRTLHGEKRRALNAAIIMIHIAKNLVQATERPTVTADAIQNQFYDFLARFGDITKDWR